jgi:imidazolonepropionase-like amidohydrolase
LIALAAWVLAGAGVQQEEVVLLNARILTITKGEIPRGTVRVKGGKIVEVGPEVKAPPGVRTIDAAGRTLAPGLVHAWSRLGLSPGAQGAAAPQHQVSEEVQPSAAVFGPARRSGITSFALWPASTGWSGQGALLKPAGELAEILVLESGGGLRFAFQAGTAGKEAFRQALEAARKFESEKKKPEEREAAVLKAASGGVPLLVEVPGPGELLHFWEVLDGIPEMSKARIVYALPPDAWKAAEELGRRKARVILRAVTAVAGFTRERVNTALVLRNAGVQVALAPTGDTSEALDGFRWRLAELVKFGLTREDALRAVTIVPAEFLGLEARIGSIEAGKDADLVLYDADPIAVPSRVTWVMMQGREVFP